VFNASTVAVDLLLNVVREGFSGGTIVRVVGGWFNDKTDTVFAYSKLPLRFWFFTAFMLQSKVSVRELAKDLRLPYNTMYRVVERFRLNLYLTASTIKLQGVVEWDEVYVTAGLKGKRGLNRLSRVGGLKRRGRDTCVG